MRQVDQEAGIDAEIDLDPVFGYRWRIAQCCELRLAARIEARLVGISAFDLGRRADIDLAHRAIEDERRAGIDDIDDPLALPHRRNAKRPRDDGHMAGAAALLEDDAAQ